MKSIITTGKTLEGAILMAVAELAIQRDKLNIEIINEPVKGLFGIIGGRDAKIKATVKQTIGDLAKTYLLELFNLMDVEARIEVTENDDSVNINIIGTKMGMLIGHRGETLDSIQYLTSLAINRESEKYKRVMIDTEAYRSKREETLKKLAKRLAHKVQKTRKKVVLEPMNPFERRIIHSTLQKDLYVSTHSEGDEPYRKVVITLK